MPTPEAGERPVVLVVEDEVLLRLAIADTLRACGFTVVEAASGDEARALVQAGVAFSLVFSDITMPGELDGAGLALWLRDNGVTAPIVLTSGLATSLKAAEAACDHVKLFLPKPYDHDAVVARIRDLLATR
ncbi:MAG: response regulator transcription factor [Hyphomonadaceae bacterium]